MMIMTSPSTLKESDRQRPDPIAPLGTGTPPLQYSNPLDEARMPPLIAWGAVAYFIAPFGRFVLQMRDWLIWSGRLSSLHYVDPVWLAICHLIAGLSIWFLICAAVRFLCFRRSTESLLLVGTVIVLITSSLDAIATDGLELFFLWFGSGLTGWPFVESACDVAAAAVPPVILLVAINRTKSTAVARRG